MLELVVVHHVGKVTIITKRFGVIGGAGAQFVIRILV